VNIELSYEQIKALLYYIETNEIPEDEALWESMVEEFEDFCYNYENE